MADFKLVGSPNYCATVVDIKNIVPLDKCDNIVHTIIMGNKVITSKETLVGDIGLFFPVECELSHEYVKVNNLYNKPELNVDITKKGYFDTNRRVRCQKLRGFPSEGLFMPITSLTPLGIDFTKISIGTSFDQINDITICSKYVIKRNISGVGNAKRDKMPKESKIIDNQFRFHLDTEQLFRNTNKIFPNDIIQCSYKIHGTSLISSKLLCKKKLNWYEKALKKIGVNIVDTVYDYIYSSRKVIKNSDINPNAQHFYDIDIWGISHNELKDFLYDGLTMYAEICGYTPQGGAIQSSKLGVFDYGCESNEHKNYIYRITYTNINGKVFEFSAKQVQDFCKENGLNAVPQLYYGYARDFYDEIVIDTKGAEAKLSDYDLEKWQEGFLNAVKEKYNEKDCYICNNALPEEGAVVRIEGSRCEVYKCKSKKFLLMETADLDSGVPDIESDN